jgi:tetratricopeptide (TPR) repeat protein
MASVMPLAAEPRYAEIDSLYFHRDKAGDLEKSQALLDDRLAAEPGDIGTLWRLSRGLVRVGERRTDKRERLAFFEKAKSSAERALELDEKCAEAHFGWGVAAGRVGQERGMLRSLFLVAPIKRHMRRAIELDPGMGRAHMVLGEILRQLPGFAGGSKRGAVAELEEAVRVSPDYTAAYPSLAEAYLALGDKEKARGALQTALEVKAPEDPGEHEENLADARRMLAELGGGL